MDKKRFKNYEILRIVMAKEFQCPPDDIDMVAILECSGRAIRKAFDQKKEEIVIIPLNKKEKAMVESEYGKEIIKRIFCRIFPFHDFLIEYENKYRKGGDIEDYFKKTNKKKNKKQK